MDRTKTMAQDTQSPKKLYQRDETQYIHKIEEGRHHVGKDAKPIVLLMFSSNRICKYNSRNRVLTY